MYVFIGGPPTAGKTHLAQEFISKNNLEILHVKTDDIRNGLKQDPNLRGWVNFFKDKDEIEYWKKNTPSQHINNVIKQAKALWPEILKNIEQKTNTHQNIIFDGVSFLPELTRKFLNFDGFYLIPKDVETIFRRLLAHSRWGRTEDLKREEAKAFFYGDTKFFEMSAKANGYKVFNNIEDGYNELARLFNI